MEKFGIFQLLDALSALSGLQSDAPQDAPASGNASAETDASLQNVQQPAMTRTPSAPSPQSEPSVKTQNAQQPEPGRNARVLSDFLARHERISKNAEKNK